MGKLLRKGRSTFFLYFQFKKFTDNNDMDTGSKVRDPKKYAMGDDLCEYLTKVGIPKRALPPNAKKGTENGIQVTASYLYFPLVIVISKWFIGKKEVQYQAQYLLISIVVMMKLCPHF